MKATEQYFPVALFIKLHNVVLASEHYILMVSLSGKLSKSLFVVIPLPPPNELMNRTLAMA